MAVIFYVVLLVFIAVYFWLKYPLSLLSHIPGPNPSLLFGNYKDLVVNYYKTQLKWSEQYGPILKYYFGRRGVVLVNSPELVYEVTQTQFDNFMNRRPASFNNKGIFTAVDEDWRYLRRTISPTFNTIHLKVMLGMIDNSVDSLMKKLHKCAESGEVVNIHHLFARMTLEVIGETAFGTDISQQEYDSEGNEFSVVANKIFRASPAPYHTTQLVRSILYELTPLITKLFIKYPPKKLRDLVDSFNKLREMSLRIVNERRKGAERKGDFIDLLIEAQDSETGNKLTDEEILGTCNIFLVAGYHTTAVTLAFLTYCVASHPSVEGKLVNEIINNFGKDRVSSNFDDLKKLDYTTQVINETLRLYPAVGMHSRISKQNTQLAGYHIPAGTEVVIPTWALARNKSTWGKDAEEFRPERYADKLPHACSATPFSFGPRNCVGMRFALMELKLTVAKVFQQFHFELAPNQVPIEIDSRASTLQPKNGVNVRVFKRK
eukprot:TRINITY_DN1585_c0_g2_i13.p1 TRINITY_DN1585_c0_g2~~TRINITY_DN1585_c0_g2_i13.p1  ORF type:complete len:490 (+),score=87.72 TRINITY_DN1585_c0_g2_i13:245-1714(+)